MKVRALICDILSAMSCPPREASSLRGLCGFLGSQLQGRVLRFADKALIDQEFGKTDSADSSVHAPLEAALRFILAVTERVPDRVI